MAKTATKTIANAALSVMSRTSFTRNNHWRLLSVFAAVLPPKKQASTKILQNAARANDECDIFNLGKRPFFTRMKSGSTVSYGAVADQQGMSIRVQLGGYQAAAASAKPCRWAGHGGLRARFDLDAVRHDVRAHLRAGLAVQDARRENRRRRTWPLSASTAARGGRSTCRDCRMTGRARCMPA